MSRETKTIKTPGGHDLEIYAYMTGLDQRAIDRIFLEYALDDDTPANMPKGKKIEIQQKQQDMLFELMILSVDGEMDKKKIMETIFSWPVADFNFLSKEVNDACSGGAIKKKESAEN